MAKNCHSSSNRFFCRSPNIWPKKQPRHRSLPPSLPPACHRLFIKQVIQLVRSKETSLFFVAYYHIQLNSKPHCWPMNKDFFFQRAKNTWPDLPFHVRSFYEMSPFKCMMHARLVEQAVGGNLYCFLLLSVIASDRRGSQPSLRLCDPSSLADKNTTGWESPHWTDWERFFSIRG